MDLKFTDFKNTFDFVHSPAVWKILEAYGIPSKIIRKLPIVYEGSESYVRVGADHTERFRVDTGVIQGDSLSSILFNIVLEFIQSKLRYIDCGIE